MTEGPHDHNEQRFLDAWAAFVQEDARTVAPPDLEARVIARAAAAIGRPSGYRRKLRRPALVGLGVAASVLLVTGAAVWQAGGGAEPDAAPVISRREPDESVAASERSDPLRAAGVARSVKTTPQARSREQAPDAILRFTADPLHETESLQLVRVRVPRSALSALGVALVEPDLPGLVDVDVVVGDDGLPRDIRRIRPVLAAAGPEFKTAQE